MADCLAHVMDPSTMESGYHSPLETERLSEPGPRASNDR
jgi:hypothetical protein